MAEDIDESKERGREAEAGWMRAVADAQDSLELATTDDGTSYYPPSEEPLEWKELGSRVMRLDIAILALHLCAARVMFDRMPRVQNVLLRKLLGKAKEKTEEWVIAKTLKKLPGAGPLVTFARFALSITEGALMQKKMEAEIKVETLGMMRQMRAIHLKGPIKPRKVRWVRSRHYTRRQRRENGKH